MSLLKQLLTEANLVNFKKLGNAKEDESANIGDNIPQNCEPDIVMDIQTDPECQLAEPCDDLPLQPDNSDISDEATQLVTKFAQWLIDNGSINTNTIQQTQTSSVADIYGDEPLSNPMVLQDEEATNPKLPDDLSQDMDQSQDVNPASSSAVENPTTPSPEDQDPNRQGMIRTVPNAHLIFKRKNADGLYDELWMYNVDKKSGVSLDIKKQILAGTDIDPAGIQSQDGTQQYELWAIGNAHLIKITGLPN